jgi:hypothetical protein
MVPNGFAVVQQVFTALSPLPATEEGKARLTRVAAWRLHQQDARWGLVKKTTGNQVQGLSTDLLMWQSTGEIVDIVTDDGGRIAVLWGTRPLTDALPLDRWVQPQPEDVTPVEPLPSPVPPVDLSEVLKLLREIRADVALIKPAVDAVRLAQDRPLDGRLGLNLTLTPRLPK